MTYVAELSAELARVGIDGRLRRRILAEIEDHLSCEPAAQLGDPADIATRFADELGSSRARRAAWVSFAALAATGVSLAVAFFTAARGFPHRHPESVSLGDLGGVIATLAVQVAFVAGIAAALRALRQRGRQVLTRADAAILLRRAGVGVGAGLAASAGLALLTIEYRSGTPNSDVIVALVAAGVGAAALLAAAPTVLAAARVRPTADGPAEDLFYDLGPIVPRPLRGRPWRFAILVALAIAIVLTIAGIFQEDGYDGALRGILDGLACLGGFALLGRYLGLRA